MDFQKNGKKLVKNGGRQDEQLLINYSGEEQHSESDSDRVKPLELPPTRLRRPKSRKIRVSPSNTKNVFTFWNFCQVAFVFIVIGTMVCMVWFTIVLKTSLDSMKKRVSILETLDRSTSKECAERGMNLKKQVAALQKTTGGVVLSDEKHFKSLLHKISVMNKSINYLNAKLKSPQSVSSIQNDISLLKKAMADTGREMTEVTDKVTQLRKIAHLQNSNIKELRIQLYNVSVQVAKLTGQPTPRPVVNTATPPWLLRVSGDSDSQSKAKKLNSIEAEKLKRNLTSFVKRDINKIIAYVKKANRSAQSQVRSLQLKLSALNKSVLRQKAMMDKLLKRGSLNDSNNTSTKQNVAASTVDYVNVEHQINNVTTMMATLSSQFGEHDKRFEEMILDMSTMNSTLHHYMNSKYHPAVSTCNCSLDTVWRAIARDKAIIRLLQRKMDSLKETLKSHRDMPPTTMALKQTHLKQQTSSEEETSTAAIITNSSVRETTLESTRDEEDSTTAPRTRAAHDSKKLHRTKPTPPPTTDTTTDDDDIDDSNLKSYPDPSEDPLPSDV